ncbi:hypothetical protein E4U57_005781 [Claviceps arundinis]|uniref:Cation efflux protein transmembrane domain-containing protein n=1 Tax=Claviceps arundinis TaxID=1623583 RepID=A0ABQ7PHP6_9HYPO|nr:hypothetical protein E4U57_005781 [Claviceps arundinis]
MSCIVPQVQRSTGVAARCVAGCTTHGAPRSTNRHCASLGRVSTPANNNGLRHDSHGSCVDATCRCSSTATLSGGVRGGRFGVLRTHRPSPALSRPPPPPSGLSFRFQARHTTQSSSSTSCIRSSSACFSTAAVYCASKAPSFPPLASSPSTPDLIFSFATVRCDLLHLAPVRGRLRTLPTIMGTALKQTRQHGDHGQDHDHDHDHSHCHSHSHSVFGHHHHHHDNTYLTSANTSDPGVRITRLGLLSNLGMAIAKFIGGWAFNSRAMVADAWHSLADLASDILTLLTVSWSSKPPNDRFPMGFGKVESLGSLGVSGMLLVGGLYMGWESAISLYGHFNPEGAHHIFEHVGHGHSHSHSPADLGIPSIHAVWLAAGTIIIKEWLYRATMKIARERKSSILASNAVHHRVDSLTGIVTLAAILGANVLENAVWLDPVGGLLISIMVVSAGFQNTRDALYELADRSLDNEVRNSVQKQAHRALANVSDGHDAELRDISGVKSGQNYLVDVELAVPGAWTVDDVKALEDAVRLQVGAKVRGVRRVRVRFVSRDKSVNEKWDEFIASSDGMQNPENHEEDGGAHGTIEHDQNKKHRD